jgi:hypothetical protein
VRPWTLCPNRSLGCPGFPDDEFRIISAGDREHSEQGGGAAVCSRVLLGVPDLLKIIFTLVRPLRRQKRRHSCAAAIPRQAAATPVPTRCRLRLILPNSSRVRSGANSNSKRRVKATKPTTRISPLLGPVQPTRARFCSVFQRLDSPGRDECSQYKGYLPDHIQHSPVIISHRLLEPLHICCRECMSRDLEPHFRIRDVSPYAHYEVHKDSN